MALWWSVECAQDHQCGSMCGTLACKNDAWISSAEVEVDDACENWQMHAIEPSLHEKDSGVASKSQGNALSTKKA